ncbi:tail fiber domain-containing protein [Halomonas litopenaei]|uniref:tail fiber domain-containing protein n=1 Tax=Halomonas litopenaei TaxID=2109328 RepID=UPI003FA0DBB8
MTTFNTGNPVGSVDPRDLYDNAENLDNLVNHPTKTEFQDRLGVPRKTWHGMEQDFQQLLVNSGYTGTGAGGAYEDYDADGPLAINALNEIFTKGGEFYRLKPDQDLPYATTTWATDEVNMVAVGDAALRQSLANGEAIVSSETGTESIGLALNKRVVKGEVGSESVTAGESEDSRTLQEWMKSNLSRLRSSVSVFDYFTEAQITSVMLRTMTEDVTEAVRQAWASGKNVHHPEGDYLITGELELTKPGQVISFEGTGGYGYGENIGLNWQPNTRFVVKDDHFTRRIRTRRKWRGGPSDPQDDPMSVVVNVQAEGVILDNLCLWLNCDYADTSPANLGDDVDVGIFVGTRVGVQMINPQVIGYYRKTGIHFDVTNGKDFATDTPYPRFPELSGTPYPAGTVPNGGDGTHIYNPYIRGARRGIAVLGALPKPGESDYTDDYYDELTGGTLQDRRGSFGFSDFAIFGGRVYGPEHHSNNRLYDPIRNNDGELSRGTLHQEPDDAPAAMYIDGLAGNSNGALHGMNFWGTRFATFEAFRVRLGRQARARFWGCHIEGRSGGKKDSSGNDLDPNDYSSNSYGNISGTDYTKYTKIVSSTYHYLPYYEGEGLSIETDDGEYYAPIYHSPSNMDLDLRADTGRDIRLRSGNVTVSRLNSTAWSPISDSVTKLGEPSSRFDTVYAASGTISTSDEREKQEKRSLTDAEKRAAVKLKDCIRAFKWNSAVEKKGGAARIHVGAMAQEVAEVFVSEGLVPESYGLFCYDSWEETSDNPAGDRYGLRYDQLLAFIIVAL